MNGAFDHYGRDELLALLDTWNDQLRRLNADVILTVEAAAGMLDMGALRDAVTGTEGRLASVAKVLGSM